MGTLIMKGLVYRQTDPNSKRFNQYCRVRSFNTVDKKTELFPVEWFPTLEAVGNELGTYGRIKLKDTDTLVCISDNVDLEYDRIVVLPGEMVRSFAAGTKVAKLNADGTYTLGTIVAMTEYRDQGVFPVLWKGQKIDTDNVTWHLPSELIGTNKISSDALLSRIRELEKIASGSDLSADDTKKSDIIKKLQLENKTLRYNLNVAEKRLANIATLLGINP